MMKLNASFEIDGHVFELVDNGEKFTMNLPGDITFDMTDLELDALTDVMYALQNVLRRRRALKKAQDKEVSIDD